MRYEPYDYQLVAQRYIEDNPRCGLILDMGLGKTVITLSAINNLIYDSYEVDKVLVSAPLKVAETTWTDEIEKWDHLQHLKVSQILGSRKERIAALEKDADIYIINIDNLVWLIDYIGKTGWGKFDMVVIDELSGFKSAKTKRFKTIRQVAALNKRFVGLTGTPNPNGYMDLWSEAYLIDRGESLGRTITSYRTKYFTPLQYKGHIVYKWGLKDGAKEVIDRKLKDRFISMQKKDYLQITEPIECVKKVRLTDSERKLYDKMGKERVLPLYEEAENHEDDEAIIAPTKAALQNKLQQMANGFIYDEDKTAYKIHSHKIEALKEYIEEAQGEQVLVFYWFKEDLKNIKEAFPEAVDIKDGKTSDIVKRWNSKEIPILLCHPASAGHGLNLQYGGHIAIWYSLPPGNLELYLQANARLPRPGQTEVVRICHIITEGTVDPANLKSLKEKDVTQKSFIEAMKAQVRGWGK